MARPAVPLERPNGDASLPRMSPLVWVAACVPIVAALSGRDLWGPDEPRYGRVAREILATGDWLVLRLNGEPYPEKPPLVYWTMAALGQAFGGLTAVAARLAGALYAAVAIVATARLARRWFRDAALADTAALMFATTYLVLWNGGRAALDLPLTAGTVLALEAGTVLVARGSLAAAIGFGVALGGAFLAKGPHALYAPVAGIVGGCVAVRAKRRLLDPKWLVGFAIAAALVAAWLVPAIRAGGPAYEKRFLGQIESRLRGDEAHDNPFHYLWPLIVGLGLPWSLLWVPALADGLRGLWRHAARPLDEGDRFGVGAAAAAVVIPLVLLSVPPPKRDVYLLPLLPHAAILAAWAVHRARSAAVVRAGASGVALLALGLGLGAFAAPFLGPALWTPRPDDRISGETLASGSVPFALGAFGALCVGGAVAAFLVRDRPRASVRAAAVSLAAAWVVAATALLPAFDPGKSLREPAAIAASRGVEVPISYAGFADPSFLWAFDPSGARRGMMLPGLGASREGAESLAAAVDPAGPPTLLYTKEKHWNEAVAWATERGHASLAVLRGATVLWRGRIGDSVYALRTNVPK